MIVKTYNSFNKIANNFYEILEEMEVIKHENLSLYNLIIANNKRDIKFLHSKFRNFANGYSESIQGKNDNF